MKTYVDLVRRRLEDRADNVVGNLERFMEPQLRFTMRIFGDCLDEETHGRMFAGYSEHMAEQELRAFADPIYLHQVTEKGSLRTWPDLPEALSANGSEEWRVHFHVPIFVERYGAMQSTQAHLERCIQRVRTSHLEIETYTWDVLPADLKVSSVDSIAREYEWVLGVLG